MRRVAFACLGLAVLAWAVAPEQSGFAGGNGKPNIPPDGRLAKNKTLNDYFPFTPPKTKADWEKRKQTLKEQVLVANGLWPMPEKTPLNPIIHGAIKRDGYTIEKVFFESFPGFYVCGNLYRPTAKEAGLKVPGILCPTGTGPTADFTRPMRIP
jgi:hypothetical protein